MVATISPVLLGELPGDVGSVVNCCSANGAVACGASIAADGHWTPVLWLHAGVSGPLAVAGTFTTGQSAVQVCTLDGTQFGGHVGPGTTPSGTPTIWNATGTPTALGLPSGFAIAAVTRCVASPTTTDGWYGFGIKTDESTYAIGWIGGTPTVLNLTSPTGTNDTYLGGVAPNVADLAAGEAFNGLQSKTIPVVWRGGSATALSILGSGAADTAGSVYSVDALGDTAAGSIYTQPGSIERPVSWNLSTGAVTELSWSSVANTYARAVYITPDGNTIVGQNNRYAVAWRSGVATQLMPLPGGSTTQAGFNVNPTRVEYQSTVAASDDGAWILGFSDDGAGNKYPVVWNAGTIIQLLQLPGFTTTGAPVNNAMVANNGSAAFGTVTDTSGNQRAVMWPFSAMPALPAPPTGVCGTATTSSVTFTWTPDPANPSPTSYTLRYGPTGSGTWTTVSGLTSTSFTLSGVAPGSGWDWQVAAVYP